MEAATPTMVSGYRHLPGHHCGSTALRNLVGHHGLEISEEMAFGLGAGPAFYYFTLPESPTRWFNGRTARLEKNFLDLTGLEIERFTAAEPDESWAAARELLDKGRPALLLTDLYYLDHYGRSAHFPGHAVVIAGYDDEVAYLSDTGFEELQTTRLENLAEARHSQHPAFPLRGHMFYVGEGIELADPRKAIPRAIEQAAGEMLEPEFGEYGGIAALERLATEVGHWPEVAEDWQWCARFAYQVIEKRGTGGGCFRMMYSRFLEEAGYEKESGLASGAAARWSELAEAFREASESEEPLADLWQRVGDAAGECHRAELALWTALSR
jgi:butirosin biosynthesis protein H-like/uncharacterized protein DUF4872